MSADDLSRNRPEGEGSPEELRTLWQERPATAAALGDEVLRAHAARVASAHRRLRVLRTLQPVGSMFGIAASLFVALRFTDPFMRAGTVLLALTFALQWIIPRRMLPKHEPTSSAGPSVSSEPSLMAYRAALLYRLEQDRGLRVWLRLVIGVPAAALLLYGMARVAPALRTIIAVEAVAVAVGLALTVAHVVRRVRRYRAELDALDTLETSLQA